MPEIETKITINRPREEVFEYLTRPDTQTVWQSNLIDFEASDWHTPPQVGDQSKGAVKVAGRRVEWTSETTDVEPPERVTFRSVDAPFPFEFTYNLSDQGDATEVTYQGATKSMGGFFGKLADPIVARMYERDMRSNLENLKALLEQS